MLERVCRTRRESNSNLSGFALQADAVECFPTPKLKNEGRPLLGDPRLEFSTVFDDGIHIHKMSMGVT